MFFANTLSQFDTVPVSSIPVSDSTPLVLEIIWRQRQIPLARGGNIRGFFPFRGESIPFESLLERDVLRTFAAMPEVKRITSQPFTIHFYYEGKVSKYTPDFLVEFFYVPEWLAERGFDRMTLIECKPAHRISACAIQLSCAYRAIREVMSTPFFVLTDAALSMIPWGGDRHDD